MRDIEHRRRRLSGRTASRPTTLSASRSTTVPEHSARILLVDDEQSIQTLLSYPLRKEGYDVVQATDGRQALDRFDEQPFDLVVLDLMLPRIDGLEVCRRLRSRSSVPIIMLTAKSEEIDKVVGLELGRRRLHHQAVLAARVLQPDQGGAAARRDEPPGRDRRPTRRRCESASCGSTSPSARVRVRGDDAQLTYVEFEILSALARAPGRVFTRDMLLARIWGDSAYRDPAHDRRPHPPSAREDRARPQGPRVPVHGPRRRLPLPRHRTRLTGRGARLSPTDDAVAAQPAGAGVLHDHAAGRRRDVPVCRARPAEPADGREADGPGPLGARPLARRSAARSAARRRCRRCAGSSPAPRTLRRPGDAAVGQPASRATCSSRPRPTRAPRRARRRGSARPRSARPRAGGGHAGRSRPAPSPRRRAGWPRPPIRCATASGWPR